MASSSVRRIVDSEERNDEFIGIKRELDDENLAFHQPTEGMPTMMALSIKPMTNNSFGNSTEGLDCVVCGDRATGKHYGAISCDGCKGFFRRSVRKNPVYECRHQNNCTIDKDKRNQCRHCRWKKCIRMGMKKEAVQKERDRLGRQRNHHYNYGTAHMKPNFRPTSSLEEDDDDDDLSVTALLRAEQTAQEYIGRHIQFDRQPSDKERVQATLETIGISMNYQLRSLIEWAKDLKSFVELSDNDKIALLRGHTGENLILGVACRSLNCDDYLLLGNHYVIPRNASDPGLSRAAGRILDELVKPLKENQLDEKEYACLKAIVFFDNDNKSLSDPMRVKELRRRIQVNLETYINQQRPLMRGRFGELLLLLPPLQNIARLMVDLVTRYNQDTKQVDDLINEMLLISKENDLDSNASSVDTDMEDSLSQDSHQFDHQPSTTPRASAALLLPRAGGEGADDDLHNVSLTESDDYLSNNLSHIHLLHRSISTDPNLNHHNTTMKGNQYLQYFTDTSNERLKLLQSRSITTPSTTTNANASYDPNSDINFLYDLVTPPSNPTSTIRQSLQTQPNANAANFFDDQWNA